MWYLEDLSNSIIKLDLSALFTPSPVDDEMSGITNSPLFLPGNIVLIHGHLHSNKNVLKVIHLTYPPAELRDISRQALGMYILNIAHRILEYRIWKNCM